MRGDAVRGALDRYLEDLAAQPLAARTREAYCAHVSAYVDWLAGRPEAEGALREPRAWTWRLATAIAWSPGSASSTSKMAQKSAVTSAWRLGQQSISEPPSAS